MLPRTLERQSLFKNRIKKRRTHNVNPRMQKIVNQDYFLQDIKANWNEETTAIVSRET